MKMEKFNSFSKQVEPYLLKSKGQMTASDAAALSGLSIEQAKQALGGLASKYHCKLKITENGDLIYDFSPIRLRSARTWGEFFEVVQNQLWKAFKAFYKAWIAITLIVYFGIFLFIAIAGLIAISSDKDKGRRAGGAGGFDAIFSLFRTLFIWNEINATRTLTDPYGHAYRVPDRPKKNFINSVYDFVFGPPRVQPAFLHQEQEFAAFLKENKGIATISDIVAISGMSREKASDFFTYSLSRFEAEAKINEEDAVLYGNYINLLRGFNDVESQTKVVYYWDEFEAPHELTGNSQMRNLGIAGMNTFNLSFGLVFMGMKEDFEFAIALGVVPVVFSSLFFLIPLFRYFQIHALRERQKRANIRRALMKAIFAHSSQKLTAESFVALAYHQNPPQQALAVFGELATELEAQSEPTERGMVYYFEVLEREMDFSRKFKSRYRPDTSLGKIELEGLS